MGPDSEAVMKDLESDINIPFVLKWDRDNQELDLVAKSIMRKKNFKDFKQRVQSLLKRNIINLVNEKGEFDDKADWYNESEETDRS